MTKQNRSSRAWLAGAGLAACAIAAPEAWATDYTGGASFQILNQSGLSSADAKFYYLGFGQIGADFVVLMPDGTWSSAGSANTGWNPSGWNQTPPAPGTPGPSGGGVVPCYQLSGTSTINIPANIAGARVYFFQVNKSSPLFGTTCNNTASSTQTNGIFGNTQTSTGGQAPFAYFSTANGGDLVTPVPGWLVNGAMPIWSYGEIGSSATAGTIDTSQVDFIGFPMNVTAQMTAIGTTYPVWNQGVGFSFSPTGQVNMGAVLSSYKKFVATLPVSTGRGPYRSNVRASFGKLMSKQGTSTVLFNPGNYIADIDGSAFQGYFQNLISNYMWFPGAKSVGGVPALAAWTGKLNTGGMIPPANGLPQTTFSGKAINLPAAGSTGAYPGYTGKTPLQAIQFTDPVTTAVAYVISPVSYQVLCQSGAVTAGCGSPAEQVFAASGSLAQPGDNNQFALLSADQQAVWTPYGGETAYNQVVARLGLLMSAAFNRGVAGGLQSKSGLCYGTATLNDCWDNQALWYPAPKKLSQWRQYFGADVSQNYFSSWLHTAQIPSSTPGSCTAKNSKCIPMMTQPNNPATLTSGLKMGMGYGFSNDENPTPATANTAQTPSKYDGIVSMSPVAGCNYITIMPWAAGQNNPTPVLSQACSTPTTSSALK